MSSYRTNIPEAKVITISADTHDIKLFLGVPETDTAIINIAVDPSDNTENIEWSVDDSDIVELIPQDTKNRTMKIRAIGVGSTLLRATTEDSGATDAVTVGVLPKPEEGAKILSVQLKYGDTTVTEITQPLLNTSPSFKLEAVIEGKGKVDYSLNWKTSNQSIIRTNTTVDNTLCYCQPLGIGSADVVVSSAFDPSKKATCHFIVSSKPTYYCDNVYVPSENQTRTCLTYGGSWSSGYYYAGGLWRCNAQHDLNNGAPTANVGARLIRRPKK